MSGEVRGSYDAWHGARAPDSEADTPWHNQVKDLLPPLSGKRVLEIACGRGGFTAWLATRPEGARPRELVAADFSGVAVEKARLLGQERGVRDVEYRQEDLTGLSFPSGSFGAAISCETIEHLPDPTRGLAELARVLVPGGRLYLTCPNYLNLIGAHRTYRAAVGRPYTEEGQPIDHLLLLPVVLAWLRRSGFGIVRVGGTGHYLPIPGRPPLRLRLADRLPLSKLFALHSVVVAERR